MGRNHSTVMHGVAVDLHGVTVAEIKGRSRLGPVAAARQDAFLALREAGWPFPRIGRAMMGRHEPIAVRETPHHRGMTP